MERLERLEKWRPWILLAVLGVLALVVYRPEVTSPLTSDARFLTVQNAFVRDLGGLARIWTADFFEGAVTYGVPYQSGYYRPIVNAVFWTEFRFFGDSALGYHVVQVLLHALNAFLVSVLITRFFNDRRAGVVAALLFVLHPVHAFAATEVAARADVLFPTFYLAGILAFDLAMVDPDRRGRGWKLGAAAVCYVLALLSKEMGITLPAVFVLVVLFRRLRSDRPLHDMIWTLPSFGLMTAYLLWRFVILDLDPPQVGYASAYSPPVLLLGSVRSLFIHMSRVVAPFGPSFPELNPTLVNFVPGLLRDPMTYVAIAVAVVIGIGALSWKRSATAAFLCGFIVITFSPLARVDNIAGSISDNVILTQERWFYLPSVALVAAASLAITAVWSRMAQERTRLVGIVLGLAALGGLAWSASVHARRLDDPFAQLRRLYLFPDEQLSRMERANKLMLYAQWVAVPTGELEEAERRARAAFDLISDSPITAVVLGTVLVERQKWQDVIQVVEPWMDPSSDVMLRHAETNPRVGDDLNRVSGQVPYLLASAYGHTDTPERASGFYCAAAQRGVDFQLLNQTWRDTFGDRQLSCQITRIGR